MQAFFLCLNGRLFLLELMIAFLRNQTDFITDFGEGQGIMAGINAGRKALGKEEVILSRSGAYSGVWIDDLETKGTNEPYRVGQSCVGTIASYSIAYPARIISTFSRPGIVESIFL